MARRRACHRLARRHRGRPAAHGGHSPPLHTNPHRATNNRHTGTDDDARQVADNASGNPDVGADHDYPHPDPHSHPYLHPHPHPQPDPDTDTEDSAANDGHPGADNSYPDRSPDAADPDEHPDAAAGTG